MADSKQKNGYRAILKSRRQVPPISPSLILKRVAQAFNQASRNCQWLFEPGMGLGLWYDLWQRRAGAAFLHLGP